MSLQTRRELVIRWQAEYKLASKGEKGRILDRLCVDTGWNRKHAMGVLMAPPVSKVKQKRRRRPFYGVNEEAALVKVWRLAEFPASKRLEPFMEEFLEALERHDELHLPEPTRSKLIKMSASTMDRLLKRHRSSYRRTLSMTKPGSLLKKHVAVRMGNGWEEDRPGFCEVDTVAHCGGDMEGAFFWTLSLTDVCTGWTECAPLKSRGQIEALNQMKAIQRRLPFKLLGIDSDNGGEFLNWHLAKYCQEQAIQFTRCRPYHKNDQCRIEQKNGNIVRKHTGYGRFETDRQFILLTRIYGLLRLIGNFYEPSIKGKSKAMTPYRRLVASRTLSKKKNDELEETYMALNPVALRKELLKAKMELLELESLVSFLNEASV